MFVSFADGFMFIPFYLLAGCPLNCMFNASFEKVNMSKHVDGITLLEYVISFVHSE